VNSHPPTYILSPVSFYSYQKTVGVRTTEYQIMKPVSHSVEPKANIRVILNAGIEDSPTSRVLFCLSIGAVANGLSCRKKGEEIWPRYSTESYTARDRRSTELIK